MLHDDKGQPPKKHVSFAEIFENHKFDFASYVVLFIGLLLSIFKPFVGGFLVGVILGIYFSKQIHDGIVTFKECLHTDGIFQGFVVIAAIIALFIASPGLCIGTLLSAFLAPHFKKQ